MGKFRREKVVLVIKDHAAHPSRENRLMAAADGDIEVEVHAANAKQTTLIMYDVRNRKDAAG